jgi:hypothetical protein
MERLAAATILCLVVAACGGGAAPESVTTAPVVPAATAPPASNTTEGGASETLMSLNSSFDRSVLSLALEPGETRPGRFRLQPGRTTEILKTVEGRYFVTDGGNVYTALNVDPDVIAGEMSRLVAALEDRGGGASDSSLLASLRDHYRGDEFQIGLTDLVRSFGAGGLSSEWVEQWSWFVQADGSPLPPELTDCRDAVAELDVAARSWMAGLDIRFTDGVWVFPIADFERALAAEIEAASICELFVEETGPGPEIVIKLSGESDLRRLEVLVDDKIYTDAEPELMFAVMMAPNESVGLPPVDPDPVPLLTLRSSFLTAIGVCGELPWIYSNFAAADSYYSPVSGGYEGPTIFDSGWYCEDEVPEDRRSAGA